MSTCALGSDTEQTSTCQRSETALELGVPQDLAGALVDTSEGEKGEGEKGEGRKGEGMKGGKGKGKR